LYLNNFNTETFTSVAVHRCKFKSQFHFINKQRSIVINCNVAWKN